MLETEGETWETPPLDDVDRKILNLVQWEFPLAARPFAALAKKLGTTEKDVLRRVQRLHDTGLIREVSAIFDTRRLGYKSSLVAVHAPPDRVDAVAHRISAHPGVSHNYRRDHEWNIWFTLAVPPEADVEAEANALVEAAGGERFRILPTLKLYKIGVKLDMEGEDSARPEPTDTAKGKGAWPPRPIAKEERAFVRALQTPIDIVPRPFDRAADTLGWTVAQVLEKLRSLQEEGIVRRFAAILRHQKAGFTANGMVTWRVPEDRVDEVGRIAASFPQVSHCYRRPTYPDWPYNLFSMVHARSREAVERVAAEISKRTGVTDYAILYSTKEYKKERVRYFV
jgi:DNA-binding Lrp family transcriptional regulator